MNINIRLYLSLSTAIVSLTVYCHCISRFLPPLYLSLSTAIVSLTVYRHLSFTIYHRCISHFLPPLYLSLSAAVVYLTFYRRWSSTSEHRQNLRTQNTLYLVLCILNILLFCDIYGFVFFVDFSTLRSGVSEMTGSLQHNYSNIQTGLSLPSSNISAVIN